MGQLNTGLLSTPDGNKYFMNQGTILNISVKSVVTL